MENVLIERYRSLLSSIDFFSQNLDLHQIVEYGFQIYNSFETPSASAIYVLNDSKDKYLAAFSQGYDFELNEVIKTDQHGLFAVRNGFILTDVNVQNRYFEIDFINSTKLSKIMPLIIDDQLFGFIISSDLVIGEQLPLYDLEFFNRFNYLMNLSLEKASRYIERNELRKEIDKHIFNLDSISQTMKMIISELSVSGIVQLSTDVIREITSSAVTSIALYDEVEKCISIRSYEDVVNGLKYFEKFTLKPNYPKQKTVYKMPEDYDLLNSIFEDANLFTTFPVEYIILIIRDSIIGFVTISKPLAAINYEQDLLKRIQDITSIMYIALTNAKQFELINFQKTQLNRHVNVLENMNRIIKTVSSADSIEELSELVITTLNTSFGVGKAIFVSLNEGNDTILGSYNIDITKFDTEFFRTIRDYLGEQPLVYYTIEDYNTAFGNTFSSYLEDINCFVLAPMFINTVSIEPFGYFLITEARDHLHETQVNMLSILANSIAPLLNQLLVVNHYHTQYLPNPVYRIEEMVNKYQEECDFYSLPFKVFIKEININPFQVYDDSLYAQFDYIIYNSYLFVFSQSDLEPEFYDSVTDENPTFDQLVSMFN